MDGKEFLSHAPGYWSRDGGIPAELWNDWKWQLKNRVTSLAQLEQHLQLSNEERSGVLLSGTKLALACSSRCWMILDRSSGQITSVFNSLCSNRRTIIQPSSCKSSDSAIFGRASPVIDPSTGRIYVATGNAPWNGSTDWGDSVTFLSEGALPQKSP